MNYEMQLNEEPFYLIKNDIKKVEYRLNDEKRKLLKIGDIIMFTKRPELVETITVKITNLKYYPDLKAMYEDTFDLYLKDFYPDVESVVKDTPYYKEEDIQKYGCVTIFFEKVAA